MGEPVTLTFVFETIAVVLALTAIGIVLVKQKTKKFKEEQ